MKPLALRLQAFGSYAGGFAIDFARLGRHGVFSITGPTGAGKSTIFDAIVYALYDDLPGFRVNSHIRSQYADRATRTEVVLEFEADSRHWILTRCPAQSRPSSRKAGDTVDDASTVKLEEAGVAGSALTRKRDVLERINELVGLDKAQFEQVVLIPQGKFEEVLKAKTQERADLLAKLFPVDVYIRTTEALRVLAAERKEAYEALARDRSGTEGRIVDEVTSLRALVPVDGAPDGPDVAPEVDVTRPDDLVADLVDLVTAETAHRDEAAVGREAARVAREAAEEAVRRWRQWQADRTEALTFAGQISADDAERRDLDRSTEVAALRGALASWNRAVEQGAALASEVGRLTSTVDASWVDGYDTTALDAATSTLLLAATVARDATALEQAERARSELAAAGSRLEEDEAALSRRIGALALTDASRESAVDRRATVEAALVTVTERVAGRGEATARMDQLAQELQSARTRADAERRLARDTDLLATAALAESGADEHLAALRAAWRAGLAGRLAAHLVDGRPCPTCGATAHPSPAATADDAPDDEALDAAEAEAVARTEERQRLEVQVAEARGILESLPTVAGVSDLDARMEVARSELDAIDVATVEQGALRDEVLRLVGQEATLSAEADAERAAIAGLSGALGERRLRWTADREAFVAEHGSLDPTADRADRLRSLATALEDLAANREAAASAEAARTQALAALADTMASFGVHDPGELLAWDRSPDEVAASGQRLADRAQHRREVEARIAAYGAEGGPEEEPDPTPAVVAEQSAVAVHDEQVGRVAAMVSRLAAVRSAVAELADGSAALADARTAKEEAETLAGLCAGLGTGPDATRLSLKNWVLAYYLRQVLAHANRRLHTMTRGRYALDLSGEHADGRRPWGLDISVLDAETGQSRPATTLSGGETFMAALALALGLADVVSAGSNYSIGALFVDEGFGSLDGDSLDTVIEVLRSLQDGGRMVGVISHVQELKDALPNGITIVSTNQGSAAALHYPDA